MVQTTVCEPSLPLGPPPVRNTAPRSCRSCSQAFALTMFTLAMKLHQDKSAVTPSPSAAPQRLSVDSLAFQALSDAFSKTLAQLGKLDTDFCAAGGPIDAQETACAAGG